MPRRASLLAGGKRFRALFCYWGWQAVAARGDEFDPVAETSPDLDGVVRGRRGARDLPRGGPRPRRHHGQLRPAARPARACTGGSRAFTPSAGWTGSADAVRQVGRAPARRPAARAGATACSSRGSRPSTADAAAAARAEFGRMRTDVMLGQYLDMLEEHSWRGRPEAELLPRAHRVIVYKSAKYSVESPLALGAALAGGSLAQIAALRGVRAAARRRLPAARRPARRVRRPRGDRQAGRRRPARGQAHGAHQPGPAEAAGLGIPARRRAARRSRRSTTSRSRCCRPRSARAVPSTRSSGSSRHNVAMAIGGARGGADRPLGARRADGAGATRSPGATLGAER